MKEADKILNAALAENFDDVILMGVKEGMLVIKYSEKYTDEDVMVYLEGILNFMYLSKDYATVN